MKIHNKTWYKYKAYINGREYYLDKKATIEFDGRGRTSVYLKCLNKSSVHMNWLELLILGGFLGDCTSAKLYYDYSFQVENCSEATITLDFNIWNPREQVSIRSCYSDIDVLNESYVMPNFQKIAKKHTRFHMFVSSLLPIGILLLVLCFLFTNPILFIVLFALWLLIFGLPSFKEIKRFEEFTNQDYVIQTLCRYANERRKNKYFISEDTSKRGKFFENIIGKMFKFDEEK